MRVAPWLRKKNSLSTVLSPLPPVLQKKTLPETMTQCHRHIPAIPPKNTRPQIQSTMPRQKNPRAQKNPSTPHLQTIPSNPRIQIQSMMPRQKNPRAQKNPSTPHLQTLPSNPRPQIQSMMPRQKNPRAQKNPSTPRLQTIPSNPRIQIQSSISPRPISISQPPNPRAQKKSSIPPPRPLSNQLAIRKRRGVRPKAKILSPRAFIVRPST